MQNSGVQTEVYYNVANWVPLIDRNVTVVEPFVDKAQTVSMTETVLVGIALMVGAALLAVLFIWAYQSGGSALFIVIYSVILFAFVVEVIILIMLKRTELSGTAFQIYLGSSVAMGLLSIIFMGVFGSKYRNRAYMSSSPSIPQQSLSSPTGY
jgi:hypothetical protein